MAILCYSYHHEALISIIRHWTRSDRRSFSFFLRAALLRSWECWIPRATTGGWWLTMVDMVENDGHWCLMVVDDEWWSVELLTINYRLSMVDHDQEWLMTGDNKNNTWRCSCGPWEWFSIAMFEWSSKPQLCTLVDNHLQAPWMRTLVAFPLSPSNIEHPWRMRLSIDKRHGHPPSFKSMSFLGSWMIWVPPSCQHSTILGSKLPRDSSFGGSMVSSMLVSQQRLKHFFPHTGVYIYIYICDRTIGDNMCMCFLQMHISYSLDLCRIFLSGLYLDWCPRQSKHMHVFNHSCNKWCIST